MCYPKRIDTRILSIAAIFLLIANAGCVSSTKRDADTGGISDREIGDVVERVANHQIVPLNDGDYPSDLAAAKTAKLPDGIQWSYPWGVALFGMERAAESQGNQDADKFVVGHNLVCARYYDWLASLETQDGDDAKNFARTTKIKGLINLGNLDSCGAMGNEMLQSMMDHPNEVSPEEQEVMARIADWVIHKQDRLPDGTLWRPKVMGGTVWPDDLYMGGVFLVRDGIYTQDKKLIDDAAEQIIHQAALEQDSDGLWFHGYFVARKQHAPFKWGRGNGWATVTIVETLSAMPENDPLRPKLIEILRKQIEGLKKVQAPDGMWRQVLDRPDLWEETSCTAMFAYGIARAVNRGWIAPDNMIVARRAFAAIAKNVGADGAVHGTCQGTSIGMDLNYYIQRERPDDDPHGRGPVMLAGTEILSAGLTARAYPPAPHNGYGPGSACIPAIRSNPANWMSRHEKFVAQAQRGGIDILFMGDSITDNWRSKGSNVWNQYYAPRHAANFGIGGDRTQHVLWRIENGELDGIHPKVTVLMIGTNNSNSDPAADIARAIKMILDEIHSKIPETKILLLAIFPRNKPADKPEQMKTIHAVNETIAKYDDGQTVRFLDINQDFLGPDGKVHADVMADFLHPTQKGYLIWANAMEPTLDEMMK